jgi:hypothetical protein
MVALCSTVMTATTWQAACIIALLGSSGALGHNEGCAEQQHACMWDPAWICSRPAPRLRPHVHAQRSPTPASLLIKSMDREFADLMHQVWTRTINVVAEPGEVCLLTLYSLVRQIDETSLDLRYSPS